jgi:4-amino-4-deoxy-L-arabinose transferase-like glycosyltransferase
VSTVLPRTERKADRPVKWRLAEAAGPHADAGAVLVLVACALAAWWPTRDLPYFWDSAAFVVDAARNLLRTHFTPLVPTHAYFAHPPLFIALVAAAWGAFGESRVVAHAVILPFVVVAVLALYGLGRRLHGPALGLWSALALLAIPLVECEVGQIYMDLPIAAMTTLGLLFWMQDRRWLCAGAFAVAGWMKIPALAAPGSILVVQLLSRERRGDRSAWTALVLPFAGVGAWLVYHHVPGWWLSVAERPRYVPHGPGALAEHALIQARSLFVEQGRWAFLAATAAGMALLRRRGERVLDGALVWPAAIVVGGFAFFAITNEFLDRYFVFMLPPYVLGSLLVLRRALVRPQAFALAAGAIVALLLSHLHPTLPRTNHFEVQPNVDLSYLDMIRIGRQAAAYVASKHERAEIYGGFHELYQLGEPWQGYVDRPLAVRPCRLFERHPSVEQLVYIHAYDPGMATCREVAERVGAIALRRFESNGKWLEVWRVPPG